MLAGIRNTLPLIMSRLFFCVAPSDTIFWRCWLNGAPGRACTITSMNSAADCAPEVDPRFALFASSSGESFLRAPNAELVASTISSKREQTCACFLKCFLKDVMGVFDNRLHFLFGFRPFLNAG